MRRPNPPSTLREISKSLHWLTLILALQLMLVVLAIVGLSMTVSDKTIPAQQVPVDCQCRCAVDCPEIFPEDKKGIEL